MTMFDCAIELMVDVVPFLPPLIALILIFNIISDLLFGRG